MDAAIKNAILILIALLGIPAGIIISKYTKEEIRKGKIELKILMIFSALAFLASFFIPESAIIRTTAGFVFLLALASLRKA